MSKDLEGVPELHPEPRSDPVALPLILASQSQTRAALLSGAGLRFDQRPSGVDEGPLKKLSITRRDSPRKMAQFLAFSKVEAMSGQNHAALVIGADQVLVCSETCFDKPENLAEARRHLQALRGQTHRLETAVVVVRAGEILWHFETAPQLTMRNFSDAFLDRYLEEAGEAVLWSVGAYQLEGCGAQLFQEVRGDYFSILGLPLLPLLEFLRSQGHGL